MKKKYRLTLEFEASINDLVEGEGNFQKLLYMQEIMEKISRNDNLVREYFKYRIASFFSEFFDRMIRGNLVEEKNYMELFSDIFSQLSPQANDFFASIFGEYKSALTKEETREISTYTDIFINQFDWGCTRLLEFDESKN